MPPMNIRVAMGLLGMMELETQFPPTPNLMCNNILNILNYINEISCQYDNNKSSIIPGHNWEHILQLLVNLGADPDLIDLWPVKEILLDCVHSHYRNRMKQSIDSIRSLIEETLNNITTITSTTESDTWRLIAASLSTFTNYIRYKYHPPESIPNDKPTPIPSQQPATDQSVSSEQMLELQCRDSSLFS